jgi:hypothetical protein
LFDGVVIGDHPFPTEEEVLGEAVVGFDLVGGRGDLFPQFTVRDVLQKEQRAYGGTERAKCLVEAVFATVC